MQSNTKDLVVFGLAGRGKSTFLNYLLQGPEDSETKKLFTTASGSSSCTQEVTKLTHQIYGTQQQVSIYDTPGVFASDLALIKWLQAMKRGIPDSFDALIWMINIKERALTCDSILVNAIGLLLSNFSFNKVIFVFTHCDTLMAKDPTPQEAAEQWISSLNATLADKSFKDKLKQNQIVYFGREEGKKYTPNYTSEFVSALNTVSAEGGAKMRLKEQLDTSAMVKTVLEKTEPSYQKMVESEIERIKEMHKETEIGFSGFGVDVKFKTCYSEDTVVYRWNDAQKRPDAVAMKEIKAGDRLVILTRESSGTFRCELEPAIVVNRYLKTKNFHTDFIKITTQEQEQKETHKQKELIIHKKHYVHVLREGNYMCILADSLKLSDSLYAFSGNPTNTNQLARLVKVKSIIPCQEDEVGVPMNIRTPSLNLIVNDLWGSSRFESDAGAWGHRLVCLASKVHPQAGQKLQNWAFALNLDKLLP